MASKKYARRFKVRMIFKMCNQIAPDDFVTGYVTRDAVVDFGEEVLVNMVKDHLEGVEVLAEEGANNCGDCAKFGNDCNAGDVDGNEDCRACKKFVGKEVSALRAIVKEMADMLNANCDCHRPCDGCDMADESKFDCFEKKQRALIARARETIGGAK